MVLEGTIQDSRDLNLCRPFVCKASSLPTVLFFQFIGSFLGRELFPGTLVLEFKSGCSTLSNLLNAKLSNTKCSE